MNASPGEPFIFPCAVYLKLEIKARQDFVSAFYSFTDVGRAQGTSVSTSESQQFYLVQEEIKFN